VNEPWYIFGPRNAGGRTPQLQPAQVPGQVQAAPVVNNITYNTPAAPAATDTGGSAGGAGGSLFGGGMGKGVPMNDPYYGMKDPNASFASLFFGHHQ
jgi:hypothetical protein